MRIKLGCELSFNFLQPTPMLAMLNIHYSRASDLEQPDHLRTFPSVNLEGYRDSFGNWCSRLEAPAGHFTLGTDTVMKDDGQPDAMITDLCQHDIQQLPVDTLKFLLGSRYCETDKLSDEAWKLFSDIPPGSARVQAVCNFVHNHLLFDYKHSSATRTAVDAYRERLGVCRDFAHLAITFCRCLNIPARYCTGYISDIGLSPPFAPMDFAAWMEVYLNGQWRVFDPRNNSSRIGRILIAYGRDAADVPLTHTFGPNTLSSFKVWIYEI